MATIPEIADRLEAATEKAEASSEIQYQVANGDANTSVDTASGPTPSIKKWFQELGSAVEPMLAGIPARLDKAVLAYQTKSLADSAASGLPNGQLVEVLETQECYKAQGGTLIFYDRLPNIVSLEYYAEIRSYAGNSKSIYVASAGISGGFYLDSSDSTSQDNGGTILVGANGRRWKRLDSDVWYVTWFSTPKLAIDAAFNSGVKSIKFPSGGSNLYSFGADMNPAASAGMLWDVDVGVTISVLDVGYLAPSLRVMRPTHIRLSALQDDYWMTPFRDLAGTAAAYAVQPMAYADADFSKVVPLAPNSTEDLTFKYLPWSDADDMIPFTPAVLSSSGVVFGYQTLNAFTMGMRVLRPGDEMAARMDIISGANPQFVVAMVRTVSGVHGAYSLTGAASAPDFFEKLRGQAATSKPIVQLPLSTHQSYDGEFAMWSVRVNTPTNFSILLSGLEVVNYDTPSEIVEAGLGSMATHGDQEAGFYDWTLTRNKADTGKKQISLALFGDSRTDSNMPDAWPQWLRKKLDTWHGLRVLKIKNYAVSGDVAAQQALHCTPTNIADVDIVIIDVGTNDIQAGTNENDYYNTVKSMIQTCLIAGKKVLLGIPDQFYGIGQSGGPGQNTQHYGEGKAIRSKCMRLAAETGSKLVDKQQCLGAIMSQYINPATEPSLVSLGLDPIVFDNIHFTAYGHQTIGSAYARAVAGVITKDRNNSVIKGVTAFNTSDLRNGWSFSGDAATWRRDSNGDVRLGGTLQAGTKTSGTSILVLPENIRPISTIRIPAITDTNAMVLINISSDGVVGVYGIAESAIWLSLDGISFPTNFSK